MKRIQRIRGILFAVIVCVLGFGMVGKAEASGDAWKTAYIDYINSTRDEIADFQKKPYALLYVNNDKIPELLINFGSYTGGGNLCTFDGEKIQVVHVYSYGIRYIQRANIVRNGGGLEGAYSDNIYSIENGRFVQKHKGRCVRRYDSIENRPIYDNDGNILYEYEWDGKNVTKSQYQRNLNAAFNSQKEKNPYNSLTNYAGIIKKINATKTTSATKTWTVTFKNGNKTVKTQKVKNGKSATAPKLTKPGYTLSWNTSFKKVTKNLTVKAVWKRKASSKPKKQTITVKSPSKGTMSIRWSKDTKATAYQIQYSRTSGFKKGTTTIGTTLNNRTVSTKISKLRSKKVYYVRVRGVKKTAGKKVYGEWSRVKKVRIK